MAVRSERKEAMANLIVYYSRKGENYWAGDIKVLSKGNTERVAEFVQEAVGGDLFEIETVQEYDASYMKCIEEAKAEVDKVLENASPNFILGADCTVPGETDWEKLRAVIDYTHTWRQTHKK